MTLRLQFRLFRSKLSFRTLYDFALNEAVELSMILSQKFSVLFYCRRKSFEYLNSPKFQFMRSRKLSELCSKIYEKSLN